MNLHTFKAFAINALQWRLLLIGFNVIGEVPNLATDGALNFVLQDQNSTPQIQ